MFRTFETIASGCMDATLPLCSLSYVKKHIKIISNLIKVCFGNVVSSIPGVIVMSPGLDRQNLVYDNRSRDLIMRLALK